MWSTRWKFIVLCGIFSFQILSLPYLMKGNLLGSGERSLASAQAEIINDIEQAERVLKRTKGILYKISHFNWDEASPESYQDLLRYERDLNEAENSLVSFLSTLPQDEQGKAFEDRVTELSIEITELNLNQLKGKLKKIISKNNEQINAIES